VGRKEKNRATGTGSLVVAEVVLQYKYSKHGTAPIKDTKSKIHDKSAKWRSIPFGPCFISGIGWSVLNERHGN
jgi:hypothetical protein